VVGILGFVQKCDALLVRELGVETAGEVFCLFVFVFVTFIGLIGLPLQGNWLVNGIWFLLSSGQVAIHA
jgi:hypothetical protein